MKIVKEVIISASIDEIWPWLSSEAMQKSYWDIKSQTLPAHHFTTPKGEPPYRLSVKTSTIAPSVTTTLELSERGKRSGLKVTISGWENLDPDKARLQMPQVSLDWERKLSLIKKSIESSLKNRSRVQ